MQARRQQANENTSFFSRLFRRQARANSRAAAPLASNPNSFRARLNRSIERHPYLWGAAKWLALGAIAATVLYFSGGLAAIPFVAPAAAQLGATIIAAATPVIATAAAALWHGVAKPVGNFFRRLFSSHRQAQFASSSVIIPSLQPSASSQQVDDFSLLPRSRPVVSPVPPTSSLSSSIATSSAPSLGSGAEEQKNPAEGLGASSSRDLALTLKGLEVDISYMYDGLTIYPKSTGEITGLAACIEKCKQLEFMKAGLGPMAMFVDIASPRTSARNKKASNCRTLIQGVGGAQFSRYIYRDADDHDLYHQDSFVIDRSHYHLKFNRPITEEQFSQMVFIFAGESLITASQARDYIRAFSQRNAAARAALDAACLSVANDAASSQDKKQEHKQAILQFISSCRSNDILVNLHEYLLDPKFDHLREISEMHPSKEWQGMDRSGSVVKTSKAWAQIEKGLSLQMIKNIKEQASHFTSALGRERSQQLAASHGFFGIKRTRRIAAPHALRTYKTLEAFSNADESRLDRKYNKIFKPS